MKKPRPLRNPLNGKPQYGGAMWDYQETERGIIEERVTFTARRWKVENGVVWRQDGDAFGYQPWVRENMDIPLLIQVLLRRVMSGQRLDGSSPIAELHDTDR